MAGLTYMQCVAARAMCSPVSTPRWECLPVTTRVIRCNLITPQLIGRHILSILSVSLRTHAYCSTSHKPVCVKYAAQEIWRAGRVDEGSSKSPRAAIPRACAWHSDGLMLQHVRRPLSSTDLKHANLMSSMVCPDHCLCSSVSPISDQFHSCSHV